jgi:hypothetical protein
MLLISYSRQGGDTIAILPQAKVPYVFGLRDNESYTVIGKAYVHGVRKGEAATRGAVQSASFSSCVGYVGLKIFQGC